MKVTDSTPDTSVPSKEAVARALLAGSGMLFVHVDARRPGVDLPADFMGVMRVLLQIGLDLVTPITDLHIDEGGFSATLSFAQSPYHCTVPWSAVYAMVGGDGMGRTWPGSMPPEVAADFPARPIIGAEAIEASQRLEDWLAIVQGKDLPAEPEPKKNGAKVHPHLRLVR